MRLTRARTGVLSATCLLAGCLVLVSAGQGTPANGRSRPEAVVSRYHPGPATAAFGLALMRGLGHGNLVFSPDSIEAAMSMAGSGARGTTAAQIADALRLSSPSAFAAVGELQAQLSREQSSAAAGAAEAPVLAIANGLFIEQGFAARSAFLEALQRSFGAVPQTVNFSGNAVQVINAWISEHTHSLIPSLLQSLSAETRLLLADAIYLKAAWAQPFKPRATIAGGFHSPTGSVDARLMQQTASLRYGSGRGYAVVELPYAGSTLALALVLPHGRSIERLSAWLDPERLQHLFSRTSVRNVQVTVPRFKLSLTRELNAPLQALGITNAFSEAADFSGISSQSLQINKVEHAATFSIDEQGTLAAAVTTVGFEATSVEAHPDPVAFDADRPFLFFLRDRATGAVLFAGRLVQPSEGS